MKTTPDALPAADPWPAWLTHGRHGGDPAYARLLHERVAAYLERLLDGVGLRSGETLLDAGCGEGALAWHALARGAPGLQVILSDASPALLDMARREAEARGVAGQCQFVLASADTLAALPDASVDVVATRSVLAYVSDKRAALRAFRRVLRPGGRIALAEPVFQDEAFEANLLRHRLENQPGAAQDIGLRLLHRWKAAQFPDRLDTIAASALCGHSERDLLRMALAEGYTDTRLQLDISMARSPLRSWQTFIEVTPHPFAASLRTVLEACTEEERGWFECTLRPLVESGEQVTADRMAYLWAVKPAG